MTTIYEMASGTEYLGEELTSAQPVAAPKSGAPLYGENDQVGLQLIPLAITTQASLYPAGLDIRDLIDKLED